MVKAITNAKTYDWQTWGIGIMRSFLSGGSSAFLTFGGSALAQLPPKTTWFLVGVNFIGMGLYRMGEFLQLHGAPDKMQESLQVAADANIKAGEAIADAQAQAPKQP